LETVTKQRPRHLLLFLLHHTLTELRRASPVQIVAPRGRKEGKQNDLLGPE
jgi:hypothetical protein